MLGYIGLTIVLIGVIPTLCYFAGLMEFYVEYGVYISGTVLLLWMLIDIMKMRNGKG